MSGDVKNLLERAAADAGRPALSMEAVYAGAARVRFRRRAALSCATLAVVAAGVVAVPRLSQGSASPVHRASVAAVTTGEGADRASRLSALLPPGVGDVAEVELSELIEESKPPLATQYFSGPLDGDYAVREDGGVGYLSFGTLSADSAVARALDEDEPARGRDRCRVPLEGWAHCVREVLPDGRTLTTWTDTMDDEERTTHGWGPEVDGELVQANGDVLMLRSSTGFRAEGSQGPLLKAPPLTAAQVRELMLRPELMLRR
ncbi:hypothetical protein ACFYPN_04580 [Streptomyces sp. NPDC005576]|uniref:hypothetical protein n=1 Tax=Streptomyces sp. NPDC005576 TaxID=3364726 RepID=UPI0036C99652